MPTPLAADDPRTLYKDTIGEAWLAVAGHILADGVASHYDDHPIHEVSLVTLVVARPNPADELIAKHADPAWLAWMHTNFTDQAKVTELGDADSYATRLFDYDHTGRDQVKWVTDRLKSDPTSRSATITTFQPHTDATYIPCVSLLDFWLPNDKVELVAYAHSIDVGKKGYGNLVELATLQHKVAQDLNKQTGRLVFTIKSAHIYDTEKDWLTSTLQPSKTASLQRNPSAKDTIQSPPAPSTPSRS